MPATLQFFVAMIASAMTDRLTRKVAYMHEEVRVLKELPEVATGKKRIAFTAEQRRRLALKGKDLSAKERAACCQIVRPETLLPWYRNLHHRRFKLLLHLRQEWQDSRLSTQSRDVRFCAK